MIHIAICDDEIKQRYLLELAVGKILKSKNIAYHIYEYGSGESLLKSDICSYDLIFLDVEMKELNGVDTARAIRRENKLINLVFVTGFTDYVFDGYEVQALNYIMKPFKEEKIKAVLDIALANMNESEDTFFLLECEQGTFKIPWENLLYFASDKRKVTAFTRTDNYEFYGKLNDLEDQVPDTFMRIHQRYLANLTHASGIEGQELLLKAIRLPISRQRTKEVMITFAKSML